MNRFLISHSGSRWCRVALHIVCAVRDHKWRWHAAGVVREFAR